MHTKRTTKINISIHEYMYNEFNPYKFMEHHPPPDKFNKSIVSFLKESSQFKVKSI